MASLNLTSSWLSDVLCQHIRVFCLKNMNLVMALQSASNASQPVSSWGTQNLPPRSDLSSLASCCSPPGTLNFRRIQLFTVSKLPVLFMPQIQYLSLQLPASPDLLACGTSQPSNSTSASVVHCPYDRCCSHQIHTRLQRLSQKWLLPPCPCVFTYLRLSASLRTL